MDYRISTTVLLLWHVAGLTQETPKEVGMLDTAVRIHISIKKKTQHQHTDQLFLTPEKLSKSSDGIPYALAAQEDVPPVYACIELVVHSLMKVYIRLLYLIASSKKIWYNKLTMKQLQTYGTPRPSGPKCESSRTLAHTRCTNLNYCGAVSGGRIAAFHQAEGP